MKKQLMWLLTVVVIFGLLNWKSIAEAGQAEARYRLDTWHDIIEFRLADGTRCVTVTKGSGVGLSCDWG